MKPHHLRVQAFGAFGGQVEVDFDRLGESGLFLLHGPTGAGKTTLLDAIGFALFGSLPGARKGARGLRSLYAAQDLPTEVCLEVSFGARRIRITRSPEYERPKRRGTGTTREKASVRLEERVAEVWELRSDGFDEAGQEIADLVGMSAEQFFQVVLLPQGEFAQFLRASSKDRAEVLQRLFATERFGQVEDWLAARRRTTSEVAAAARAELSLVLARVAEVTHDAAPEAAVQEWAEQLLQAAGTKEALAGQALSSAQVGRDAARAALDEATARADRQCRRRTALARRAVLDQERPELLVLRQELEAASRAAQVAALLDAAESRRADRDQALGVEAAARAGLVGAGLGTDLSAAALGEVVALCRAREGRLEALRAVAATQTTELAAVAAARADQTRARSEAEDLERTLLLLPTRRERELARLTAGRTAAERSPVLRAQRDRLVALRPDVVQLVQLEARLLERAEEHLAARETHVTLQQKANDLRTASINTMVARLAFALVADTPCPVCGSLDHPDPSALRDEGVSSDDEQAARRDADDAMQHVADLEALLAADRATAAALRQRVEGLTPAEVDGQLAELDLDLEVLEVTVAEVPSAEAALAEVAEQERVAETDLVALAAKAEAAQRRADEAQRRADSADEQLREVLDGAPDLESALGRVTQRVATAETVLAAARGVGQAQEGLDRALREAETACAARGFASAEEAQEATRDEEWRVQTEGRLRAAADAVAAVNAELDDPALDVALDPPAPVDACAEAVRSADVEVAAATAARTQARDLRTSLDRLVPQLVEGLHALHPLEERASRVRRLADLCAGGGANGLRMTLSSFVLAARLEEVAAAASVRLRRMTQGRYELVHSDGAARGGARSGLGLLARDAWTGQDRETATLSGGETFLASLALALGLADVVTEGAGGARIEALFVDEGFGTLDEETLDEVMDVLDGLREGGRLVGLVSHVSELRQRIPAQVEVRKTRTGSDAVLIGC